MDDRSLEIKLDLNVLNHLGFGLYSNTPAVLTEIIANAWDADAHDVRIDIDEKQRVIVIKDNGIGMDYDSLQEKFLTVGYARRSHGETTTPGGRQCMGRKGIGKLAMFSLALEINVISKVEGGEATGFTILVNDLRSKIENGETYFPTLLEDTSGYDIGDHGTLIELRRINKIISQTKRHLKRRIARRFSVISERNNFHVYVDGSRVTLADRGFYKDIQFLWTFGDEDNAEEVKTLSTSFKHHNHYEGRTQTLGLYVTGFIGSVAKPEQLKEDLGEGEKLWNNTITVLANGRVFEEDIQKRLDDSKLFNSYLVGELQVNALDDNDQPDIAVSSRQGIQEDDPRFKEFVAYIKSRLSEMAVKWDEWRRDISGNEILADFPAIKEWLDTLNPHIRPKARQFISKIGTIRFTGDEEQQTRLKREVLKSQVLAFEKYKLQDNIDAVDSLNLERNLEEFRSIMVSIRDLEASIYHDVIRERLSVIKKLNQHDSNQVRERVVQDHIYEHLWLVDPSWEHKRETDYERTLTEHLKSACPDSEEGARIDIGYRTTSGRYIIIELKKPGINTTMEALISQGTKYSIAINDYFQQNPGSCPSHGVVPVIEIVFLVGKRPHTTTASNAIYEVQLRGINATINTYKDLVTNATKAYEEYLGKTQELDKLQKILEAI
ncbi:MAG: ATP-binding protein [Gammaproteobacteria bacterium]|nr:ATP-binding protein [Gammaproteobacteria bacterium]